MKRIIRIFKKKKNKSIVKILLYALVCPATEYFR